MYLQPELQWTNLNQIFGDLQSTFKTKKSDNSRITSINTFNCELIICTLSLFAYFKELRYFGWSLTCLEDSSGFNIKSIPCHDSSETEMPDRIPISAQNVPLDTDMSLETHRRPTCLLSLIGI